MKRFLSVLLLLGLIFSGLYAQETIVPSSWPSGDGIPDPECRATISRTTSDGSSNFNRDNYRSCISTSVYNNNPFNGRDDSYRLGSGFDFTNGITIKLQSTSSTRDLDLFVLEGGNCIERSILSAGNIDELNFTSWNSSWLIVVDGYNSSQNGSYELTVIATCSPGEEDPPRSDPCSSSTQTLLCNSSVNGDTRNGSDNIRLDAYKGGSCLNLTPSQEAANPFTGNDIVYRLVGIDPGTPVTIRLNANTDLDMFIYSCFDGLGTGCVSANGATPSSNETISIIWESRYFIIIDSPSPSSNGSYTLSAVCTNPCDNNTDNNCDDLYYEYTGTNGRMTYDFGVSDILPSNGRWTATRNGSQFNLGSGSRKTYTFNTAGEYIICYRYTDSSGCEKNCCKRININNPYDCNLVTKTRQGNNYILSIPGVNDSDVECWLVVDDNTCLQETSSRVTVPIPTGNRCVRYCVKYYDRVSRCYRICCIEICNDPCDPIRPDYHSSTGGVPEPDCDFIVYRYNRSIGGLSYKLSVPTNLPNNGFWEATDENGARLNLGSGRVRNYNFPFVGRYLICYRYFDNDGCEQLCCRWIYISDPFDCNQITTRSSGNNYILSLNGVSGTNIVEWIDDETGNVLNRTSSQITVPVPEPENCRFYSVIYFDPTCNCYRICCIRICGPTGGNDCCPDRDANLSSIVDIYRNICNCGVTIYCYNGNGFRGYFVHTGYLCCNEGTGTIFDCQGNIRGVERVPNGAIFDPNTIGEVLWDGCNDLHINGPTGTEGPTGPTGPTGPPFLNDYPWLADVLDFNNCSGTTIEVHQGRSTNYVYINTPSSGVLYETVGTVFCTDYPGLNCADFYGIGLLNSWSCSGSFTSDPCKENPENCGSQRVELSGSRDIQKGVRVYPNPSRGKVFIDVPLEEIIKKIEVLDISGKLIESFNYSDTKRSGQIELNITDPISGIYLLQIVKDNEIITKRIVLE